MGTNYYLKGDKCDHCGRFDEGLHIGKSSAGWCFSLRVYPDKGIDNISDWVPLLHSGRQIVDEYGLEITPGQLVSQIALRGKDTPTNLSGRDLQLNSAEPGPNNMLRHRIGNGLCVGHGEGTWDYMDGDFS